MTEEIQTLECRLGCISRRSKRTLNSLKSDVNVFRGKPSLGALTETHIPAKEINATLSWVPETFLARFPVSVKSL